MRMLVAEKPSVAKAIAKVILGNCRRKSYGKLQVYYKDDVLVTSVFGHFLDFFFESLDNIKSPLDFFKTKIKWVILDKGVYESLIRLHSQYAPSEVIVATDNDIEGEFIGYEVEKALGVKVKRMRFNSLKPSELRKSYSNLEPSLNYGMVNAAKYRRITDLVLGYAFSSYLSYCYKVVYGRYLKNISWGTVQTPTLKLIYDREMEVRNFKPEVYYQARMVATDGVKDYVFETGRLKSKVDLTPYEGKALRFSVTENVKTKPRPIPLNTDELVRKCVSLFNLKPKEVLQLAERLYNKGLISYPRTETNKWRGVDLDDLVELLRRYFKDDSLELVKPFREGDKDDKSHTTIYPIALPTHQLSAKERKILDFIYRVCASNLVSKDAKIKYVTYTTRLSGVVFRGVFRVVLDEGYWRFYKWDEFSSDAVPKTDVLTVKTIKWFEKTTQPPPRYTLSSLLKRMEKDNLGTDATRPTYPDLLLRRRYVSLKSKTVYLEPLGEAIIEGLQKLSRDLVENKRVALGGVLKDIVAGRINWKDKLKEDLRYYYGLLKSMMVEEKCVVVADSLRRAFVVQFRKNGKLP